MDEILGTRINIKFWKSKLGVKIKPYNGYKSNIRYICHTGIQYKGQFHHLQLA